MIGFLFWEFVGFMSGEGRGDCSSDLFYIDSTHFAGQC